MPIIVPVYFDYASPLCYIAWRIVEPLAAELDLQLRWRPVHIAAQHPEWKLGPLIGGDTRAKIERVAQETEIALAVPERWLDSRAALEGFLFAEQQGRAGAYHGAVFRAAYERGEDIGNTRVLVQIAGEAGLPVGTFMEGVATRRMAPLLAAALEEARTHGVVGYPTFFLGEFPLTGIQAANTMRLLLARHVERCRQELH